jgi:hypothetical protein
MSPFDRAGQRILDSHSGVRFSTIGGQIFAAVNAGLRIDVKHLIAFTETITRTYHDAVRIFAPETTTRHDESHEYVP